jgi:hypothetical protein
MHRSWLHATDGLPRVNNGSMRSATAVLRHQQLHATDCLRRDNDITTVDMMDQTVICLLRVRSRSCSFFPTRAEGRLKGYIGCRVGYFGYENILYGRHA